MAFTKRREMVFAYTVKDANPNGDPLNANHPRFDEETGQILASDVRIKRTVRDHWISEGHRVFVDGEKKTLKSRVEELRTELGTKTGRETLAQCIDSRLFGATFALGKESFAWTGPVQFKWARTMHRAKAQMVQGTAAFATKDDSDQRSFRNEYIVPFAFLAGYGVANQHASRTTGATDEDIAALEDGLWKGTANLITRSKVGHVPRFLCTVTYSEGFSGLAGALDEKMALTDREGRPFDDDAQLALRSVRELRLDVGDLAASLLRYADDIEQVRIVADDDLEITGLEALEEKLGERLVHEVR
ncbi:MAG: type I-B CRISPR-associated protein Cas7/Csh2 [Synergistales bacterium]|nr:type I-B CRISPR-associated protein Cas7/Csh2 [Synergistales bacterium]